MIGVLLSIWLIVAGIVAMVGGAGAIATVLMTAGIGRDRFEARAILVCAAAVPLAPLWPVAVVVLGARFGPDAMRGLWSDAELPSPAERRARRAAERDHLVRVQQRRIADLERELGIGGGS